MVVSAFAKASTLSSSIQEQLSIRQTRQVVVHRIVQQPLFRILELGHVGQRPDETHHLAVRAHHGAGFDREP